MRTRAAFLLLTMLAAASCAHRRSEVRETREVREVREERRDQAPESRKGWVKLGDRSVDGARDRDVIAVGRQEGEFRRIMIVVERSAIELNDIVVNLGDGRKFSPPTRLVFGANTRSAVIDLPGAERVIKNVEFRYGNLPGGGRAEVELWAQ